MPELPEVETIARALRQGGREGPAVLGRTIIGAEFLWPRMLQEMNPTAAVERLRGQQTCDVSRRAKWLILSLTQDTLLLHLRMSGDLRVLPAGTPSAPHDRFTLNFEDGWRLAFNDARKFGRIILTNDPQATLANLGPEPLSAEFSVEELYRRLQDSRRQVKPLLMDQSFLAGLGNIYTDEALHLAGIHPLRAAVTLTADEAARLWAAIRTVLQAGIERNGASIDWVYRGGDFQNDFNVYGRTGQPCKTCGQPVQRLVVGQRGTHICPHCQPLAAIQLAVGENQ